MSEAYSHRFSDDSEGENLGQSPTHDKNYLKVNQSDTKNSRKKNLNNQNLDPNNLII